MCSFCWAYRPAFSQLGRALSHKHPDLNIVPLLGGLAPDSNAPMPAAMQEKLQATWRYIEKNIPGTPFNFDFWQRCQPRRSTYPACRAVIAVRQLAPEKENDMVFAIQSAYYLYAENPSNDDTLVRAARRIGLSEAEFTAQYHSGETEQAFLNDRRFSQALGIDSFPSLVWAHDGKHYRLPADYLNASKTLALIEGV